MLLGRLQIALCNYYHYPISVYTLLHVYPAALL